MTTRGPTLDQVIGDITKFSATKEPPSGIELKIHWVGGGYLEVTCDQDYCIDKIKYLALHYQLSTVKIKIRWANSNCFCMEYNFPK